MMSERVGDGFSHRGNVFSRRGAACAEFSQSILSMLPPLGECWLSRCVSKSKSEEASGEQSLLVLSRAPKLFERSSKSEEASGEQKFACAIPSAEAFRAKLKERLPVGRLYVVLQAI